MRKVYADIYETRLDTQLPTKDGFHVHCSETWLDDFEVCELTYEERIKLSMDVYNWLTSHLRKPP